MTDLGTVLTAIVTPFDEQRQGRRGVVRRADAPSRRQRLRRVRRLRHDRRGLDADRRGAARPDRAGASRERPPGVRSSPATGTNDTAPRRAPDRTRDRARASTRCCRSPPTTTAPAGSACTRHYEAVARGHRQADPALQHPGAHRHRTCRPTCSPSSRRSSGIEGVKQANAGELQPIDGPRALRRRRRPRSRARSTWAAPAGSSSPATSSATRCAGWSTSPSTAPRSTRRCRTSTRRCS